MSSDDSNESDFYLEAALASTIAVMIANAALMVKIRYGPQMVTKLTMRPYLAAMGLLITNFILQFGAIISVRLIYRDDKVEFYRQIATAGSTTSKIFSPLYIFRMAFALLFFVTRAFEAELMLIFIRFQRMLRLESLVVERDKF